MNERLQRALERIKAETVYELIDTPEKAQAEGVQIGTTVVRRQVPAILGTAQDGMDDFFARELLQQGLVDLL